MSSAQALSTSTDTSINPNTRILVKIFGRLNGDRMFLKSDYLLMIENCQRLKKHAEDRAYEAKQIIRESYHQDYIERQMEWAESYMKEVSLYEDDISFWMREGGYEDSNRG